MAPRDRPYRYVGPEDVRITATATNEGHAVRSLTDLSAWLDAKQPSAPNEPFTFVIGLDGVLRLAPRRSEHVACASGADVLAAGEIAFARTSDGWTVTEVTNQSTGYCPDPDSWPALATALDRLGLHHPDAFTHAFTFRRCDHCHERNIVKDGDFTCAVCEALLPPVWNFHRTST